MDSIKARIKAIVIEIDSSFTGNLILDTIIDEIVDRVLVFTNRNQLVRQYEEDVVDYPITDKSDTNETYYTFWKRYTAYPIPTQLESPIARVVIAVVNATIDGLGGKEVKSISDLGQSITFGEEADSYLASTSDSKIFMSMSSMLDKFKIGTVVERS